MIRLVAFDWNGTLLADTISCYEANQYVYRIFGHKPITLSVWRDTYTVPIIDFYTSHDWTRKEFLRHHKAIGKIFHPFYEKRAAQSRSRSGARQILQWLARQGIESVIFSNHTLHGIEFQLQRLDLAQYITTTLAHTVLDGSYKIKTKEQKLFDYLRVRGFKKSEVLIVGDTQEEIEIGSHLNIKTAAITGGYSSTKRLRSLKPKFLIHSMIELKKIVEQLNKRP